MTTGLEKYKHNEQVAEVHNYTCDFTDLGLAMFSVRTQQGTSTVVLETEVTELSLVKLISRVDICHLLNFPFIGIIYKVHASDGN